MTYSPLISRLYGRLPLELAEYYLILEYLTWLRAFHTAKNRCPATCITAIVTHNRSLIGILVGTSLNCRRAKGNIKVNIFLPPQRKRNLVIDICTTAQLSVHYTVIMHTWEVIEDI